jgi:hypothetical protein
MNHRTLTMTNLLNLTHTTIETLVAERKLTSEGLDPNTVSAIREEMERAQARRLQPHFIGAFFHEAFALLGGRLTQRETGRFEITRVPGVLKERDRLIGHGEPVLDRYACVTLEETLIASQYATMSNMAAARCATTRPALPRCPAPPRRPQSERTESLPRQQGDGTLVGVNYREAYDLFVCNGVLFNHESPRRGETFCDAESHAGGGPNYSES